MMKFQSYRTALLVVNMQTGEMDAARRLGIDTDALAEQIGTEVCRLREAGVLIVFVNSDKGGALYDRMEYCSERDYLIEKPCSSGFFGTDLRYILMNHHVDNTLTCGLRTNLDCRATAIDATSHDLVSYIVSDLTQTDCEETKQFHLREMSWYFSLPLTTAEIHARLADGRL